MHGILRTATRLEVQCTRRRCGKERGIVVLHTFDLETGALVKTERYKNPLPTGRND